MRGPDAAWISSARIDGLTAEERLKFPSLCPEFIIEVLSDSDSRRELEKKMERWINAGSQPAWMIDPYAGDVPIYRVRAEPERLGRPHRVVADAVVEGFSLEMARIWEQ